MRAAWMGTCCVLRSVCCQAGDKCQVPGVGYCVDFRSRAIDKMGVLPSSGTAEPNTHAVRKASGTRSLRPSTGLLVKLHTYRHKVAVCWGRRRAFYGHEIAHAGPTRLPAGPAVPHERLHDPCIP